MAMCKMEGINVPIVGIVENMVYFTPVELPENKDYILGKDGNKRVAEDNQFPFFG